MIDMKNKNAVGFPWPKPIPHAVHRGMGGGSRDPNKAICLGVLGALDGSELRLVNAASSSISIDRINAMGAAVWTHNVTSIRAGVQSCQTILCCYYDSADAAIYVLSLQTNVTDANMWLDRIAIANGAVTHIGGVINIPGFPVVDPTAMRLARREPGVGNLIVTRKSPGTDFLRGEISATNGSIAVAPTLMLSPNGVYSNSFSLCAVSYVSADGLYHLCSLVNSSNNDVNTYVVFAGKNNFTISIRCPITSGHLSGILDTGWPVEVVLIDANTVAAVGAGIGTRYYARTDFDKWLKTIVDAQGI